MYLTIRGAPRDIFAPQVGGSHSYSTAMNRSYCAPSSVALVAGLFLLASTFLATGFLVIPSVPVGHRGEDAAAIAA